MVEAPLGHESPFSKASKRLSYIDTVKEVEDEEEEGKGDLTITAAGLELSPVCTPQFDTIRSVPKLAIMDPIESPSILVARTSEDSFSGYSSCSSSYQTDKESGQSRRPRQHHRRRRSLAAMFGRAN